MSARIEQMTSLLGVERNRIFHEVIGGGQADFREPWEHLSPDERVLLHAYYNLRPYWVPTCPLRTLGWIERLQCIDLGSVLLRLG